MTETDRDRQYWSSSPWVNEGLRDAILHSGILLVPQEGFRDHTGPVFPVGTDSLFNFLRKRQTTTGLEVELAVEDAQYKEVALHANTLRIATAVVTLFLAPLTVDLLADYIKEHVGSRADKTEVHSSLIIEQTDGSHRKSIHVEYKGPASDFERSMKAAIEAIHTGSDGPHEGGKQGTRKAGHKH